MDRVHQGHARLPDLLRLEERRWPRARRPARHAYRALYRRGPHDRGEYRESATGRLAEFCRTRCREHLGAIDWPRHWDSRPQPPPDAVSRLPGYPAIQRGPKGNVVKAFQRGITIVLGR